MAEILRFRADQRAQQRSDEATRLARQGRGNLLHWGRTLGLAFLLGGFSITCVGIAKPYVEDAIAAVAPGDDAITTVKGPIAVPEVVKRKATATVAVRNNEGAAATGVRIDENIVLYPSSLVMGQDCGSMALVSGKQSRVSRQSVAQGRIAITDIAADQRLPGDTTLPLSTEEKSITNSNMVYVVAERTDDTGVARPVIHPGKLIAQHVSMGTGEGSNWYTLSLYEPSSASGSHEALQGSAYDRDDLKGAAILNASGELVAQATTSYAVSDEVLSGATKHETGNSSHGYYVAEASLISIGTLDSMRQATAADTAYYLKPAC